MNPILKNLGLFIRDLLNYDEQLVKIGRFNFEQKDFNTPYIVIDALGNSQRIGNTPSYDGDREVHNFSSPYMSACTVTFYGDNAYERAGVFSLMLQTEQSKDLQNKLGLTVYNSSSITDLKLLTGAQYSNRVEVSLNARLTSSINIPTLRIDTPVFEFKQDE